MKVFDVGPTHGLIQVIHGWDGEPDTGPGLPACGYAGMGEWPEAGVGLGLVELATGEVKTWEVYARARKQEECTSATEAERLRGQVEAAATAAGLDFTRRPEGVEVPPDDTVTLPLDGRDVTFTASTTTGDASEDGMEGLVTLTLRAGDQVLYRSSRTFPRMMAGVGELEVLRAWPVAGGAVFLEHYHEFSGRGGSHHAYTLTPVLVPAP